MQKRRHKRFTKRIEVEFGFGDRLIRGFSSDLSEKGLFVRTRTPLATGSAIEMTFYLPDDSQAKAQGIVRRAVRSHSSLIKSGMGVELTAFDQTYAQFLGKIVGQNLSGTNMVDQQYQAIRGGPDFVRNEPRPNSSSKPEPVSDSPPSGLSADVTEEPDKPEYQIIACPSCNVKNRIPTSKLSLGPKCGKCRSALTV